MKIISAILGEETRGYTGLIVGVIGVMELEHEGITMRIGFQCEYPDHEVARKFARAMINKLSDQPGQLRIL